MPFKIDPKLIENDEARIEENESGNLEIVHAPSGTTLEIDSNGAVSTLGKTNEEVQDAVGGIVTSGLVYDDAANTISIPQGSGSGLNADTVDGKDSTDFVETIDNIDADTLDGKDSTDFVETIDNIDADTLDGKDSTSFVQSSSGIIPHTSFTSLTNVPTTEIGDVFHVDSEGLFINTNDGTPSDTTTPLQDHIQNNEPHHSVPKTQVVSLTTSSSQDVNQTTTVNWDEHIIGPSDNAFSHTLGNSSVTVNESGTYKIYANLYTDSSSSRTNPSFRFRVNGSEVAGRSGSAYARRAEGHRDTSTSLEIMRELSSGDTIDIRTFAEASGGTCNLQNRRSIFTIEKLIR